MIGTPLVIGLIVGIVALRCLRALLSPCRSIPGPFLARFTRLWYLYQVLKHDWEKTNIELHRKYGPIVRMDPKTYSVDDPSAIRLVYGHGTKFTIKSEWYLSAGNPDPHGAYNMFAELNPRAHAAFRKRVASFYSMTASLKAEDAVANCVKILEHRFTEMAKNKQTFDIQHWLQCYAADAIIEITLSKRLGFLDEGKDVANIMAAMRSFLVYANYVGVYPRLHKPCSRVMSLLGKSGLEHMNNFVNNIVGERLRSDEEKNDFLGNVVKLHKTDPQKFSVTDIISVATMNIGGGSDTTSIAMSGIMWYLMKSRMAMASLRSEIDEMEAKGELSDPVTFQETLKMPYLQAVIREGMRLHPSTGYILGRQVPAGGAVIAGIYIPQGNVIGINPWVAHVNRDVYGEDADCFRPERWLEANEDTRKLNAYYLPFGQGSRTCIGKNISLMEISKTIPQLIRRFDFQLVDPSAELKTDNAEFVWPTNIICTTSLKQRCDA